MILRSGGVRRAEQTKGWSQVNRTLEATIRTLAFSQNEMQGHSNVLRRRIIRSNLCFNMMPYCYLLIELNMARVGERTLVRRIRLLLIKSWGVCQAKLEGRRLFKI